MKILFISLLFISGCSSTIINYDSEYDSNENNIEYLIDAIHYYKKEEDGTKPIEPKKCDYYCGGV